MLKAPHGYDLICVTLIAFYIIHSSSPFFSSSSVAFHF